MKILLCLCVILNALTEDTGKTLYAFEPLASQQVSLPPVTISLEEAIERVRERHPDLKLQEIALERARQEVRFANRAFLPDIDIDYIASSAAGGLGLIVAAARVLKPVFSLKTLLAERKIRKLLQGKERILIRARELEVTQEVKELYAALLIQEKLAEVFKGSARSAEERFHLKEIHHRAGGLTDEELLKEKLSLGKARSEELKARVQFYKSEFAFRTLLRLPAERPLTLLPLSFEKEDPFPLSLKECFILASEKNPVVQALRLVEEASLRERDKTKPRFVVDGLFAGLGESGDLFQGRTRLGMTGNLVLYDWGKRKIKNRLRDLDHESLLLEDGKTLDRLSREIHERYSELILLGREIRAARSDLRLARESVRRARILARLGRIRPEEALEGEAKYSQAQVGVFGKRLQYFLARERLLANLGLSGMGELREILSL